MERLQECLKKKYASAYANCVNVEQYGQENQDNQDSQDSQDNPHISVGEGIIYSPEGLVDDDYIMWPIDLSDDDKETKLDESIECEGPCYNLTLEPFCKGFEAYEHTFVAPPKDILCYCELCLDNWIKRTNVFSKCKYCEFKICESCYEKNVLVHD